MFWYHFCTFTYRTIWMQLQYLLFIWVLLLLQYLIKDLDISTTTNSDHISCSTDFKSLRSPSRSPSPWKPRHHPRSSVTPCLVGSPSLPLHHQVSGGKTLDTLSDYYPQLSFSLSLSLAARLPPCFSFCLPHCKLLMGITVIQCCEVVSTKSLSAHILLANTELYSPFHWEIIHSMISLAEEDSAKWLGEMCHFCFQLTSHEHAAESALLQWSCGSAYCQKELCVSSFPILKKHLDWTIMLQMRNNKISVLWNGLNLITFIVPDHNNLEIWCICFTPSSIMSLMLSHSHSYSLFQVKRQRDTVR